MHSSDDPDNLQHQQEVPPSHSPPVAHTDADAPYVHESAYEDDDEAPTTTTTPRPPEALQPNYYDLLEIRRETDDLQAIKRAYKRMAVRLHPDRGGSEEDFAVLQR